MSTANRLYTMQLEHVLGTSGELQVHAPDNEIAEQVERRVIDEIERLAAIYSQYDSASELRQWLASTGQPSMVSPELRDLLRQSERWIAASRGAFHPAVAELTAVWRAAADRQELPTERQLEHAVSLCRTVSWQWSSDGRVSRLSDVNLDFNALAKGVIIDRAVERVRGEFPAVSSLLLNIGGDLRVIGTHAKTVAIADPHADAENDAPLAYLQLVDRAMATSGNYRRGVQIGGQSYSHILNPQTGQPCDHLVSATVLAREAATADVLATVLSVMSIDDGLELVGSLPDVDCLLVDSTGKQYASAKWHRYEVAKTLAGRPAVRTVQVAAANGGAQSNDDRVAVKDAFPVGQELLIELELNRPDGGRGYRRPYVAVWVEDEKGFPVRTIALWLQTTGPGPRWHRDLRRWYRGDEMRLLVDDTDLIDTISSATRPAGKYKLVWDGLDDLEQPLAAGKYTLFLEAAREHGTYQLIRYPFELNGKPFGKSLDGNVEIKAASLKFRPATKQPAK
ncbi:MAG: DUF2271 domain-containing protein [Planctomycetales bacterium]|nr:DUF2271 domain-containing protein [Planctomycetales bacterium]